MKRDGNRSVKKALAMLLGIGIINGLFAALPPVSYRAPVYNDPNSPTNGIAYWETRWCSEYTVVDAGCTNWVGGWYVVTNKVTINGEIELPMDMTGESEPMVHLILTDEGELNADRLIYFRQLGIYGQEENTGALNVNGIHNGWLGYGSPLTINGGRITSTCTGDGCVNGSGAGIGANSLFTSAGGITINDGIVYARGAEGCAGIGGGDEGYCWDVTINGGTVTAVGGDDQPGIGGDHMENIRINGGSVTALGGIRTDFKAAIGLYVNRGLEILADNNNPPTTKIANDGGDLASALAGIHYVTINPRPPVSYRAPVYNCTTPRI